ncbi:hypothetical protein Tco_0541247 [Tanacetum coccineum]
MDPSADKKKDPTTSNSSKKTGKTNASTSGNGTFSLSNSFEAINVDNTSAEEVYSGGNTSMSGVQEEEQSSTPLVEKNNMFEQQLLTGKRVLLDDEGKPLEKIDYPGDHDSEDEVEPVDNEMASFLASKPSGVVMVLIAFWNNGGKPMGTNLQAGGEYEDKDKDFEDIRRSPYKDKDTEDIRRYS